MNIVFINIHVNTVERSTPFVVILVQSAGLVFAWGRQYFKQNLY